MINLELLQKGIIETLETDADLRQILSGTNQIKEVGWQGIDFTYPAIRVDIQPEIPEGTGTDRTRISRVFWNVLVYSEKPSSYEANRIMSLVTNALFNKQMYGNDYDDVPNFILVRIDLVNVDGAFRISDRLWLANATFEGTAHLR